jgi:hypothetical protein
VSTRDEIDAIVERARADDEDGDTTDGSDASTMAGDADDALIEDARDLKTRLSDLGAKLREPPGTKGIIAETDLLNEIAYVQGSLSSSWDRPTPAQEAYLRRAEARLRELVAEVNRVFEEDVAGFRERARTADLLEGLKPGEPLRVPAR